MPGGSEGAQRPSGSETAGGVAPQESEQDARLSTGSLLSFSFSFF